MKRPNYRILTTPITTVLYKFCVSLLITSFPVTTQPLYVVYEVIFIGITAVIKSLQLYNLCRAAHSSKHFGVKSTRQSRETTRAVLYSQS